MKIRRFAAIYKIFPLALVLVAGFGCATLETIESTRIPQDEIQQIYRVSADRGGVQVAAVFYHGNWGKTVDLDAPSRIEHNELEMPQISPNFLKGTTYETSFADFPSRHVFVYTNGEGRVFRNEMNFEPLEPGVSELSVGRSRNTLVPLSRRVGENERIRITLESLEKRPAANLGGNEQRASDAREYELSLNDELDEARTAIVLKPKNLKRFAAGRAVLKIEASRDLPLQQATAAGGSMSWTYTSTIAARIEN